MEARLGSNRDSSHGSALVRNRIALCREAPAAVNDGEVVVASKEELQTAPLNGKRLLALWNALPDVDKRRKVGAREALIDQLWSVIAGARRSEPAPDRAGAAAPGAAARRRARCGGPRALRCRP